MENNLIDRQEAIDAIENLVSSMSVCINVDEYHGMRDMKYRALKAINELPSAQPDLDEWCPDCKEYDKERNSCPRWNRVIKETLKDLQEERKTQLSEENTTSDCISRQAVIDALTHKWDGMVTSVFDVINSLPSAQPEQPSEIQDILNYLDTVLHPIISPEHWNVYSELHDMISTLSSAQPERKTGKWVRHYSRPNVYADMCWHCSNCGYKTPDNWANKWKFCPNCGARMQEGEDNG